MTRAGSRLDQQHDARCPTVRGADPDECRCADHDQAGPADRPATAAELRRMHALFRKAGITDRVKRLTRTGELIGRRVASCSGLSERETRVVCAWLDQKIAEAQR